METAWEGKKSAESVLISEAMRLQIKNDLFGIESGYPA